MTSLEASASCSGDERNKTYVVQRDLPDGRTRRVTIAAMNVIGLERRESKQGSFSPTSTEASTQKPAAAARRR